MLCRYAGKAERQEEGPCLKHLLKWRVNLAGSPWWGRKSSGGGVETRMKCFVSSSKVIVWFLCSKISQQIEVSLNKLFLQ